MKHFYIELLCRDTRWQRPDSRHIYIPVVYAWQEGPEDLHIQVTPQENLTPREHDGDYIIPASPWLLSYLRRGRGGFEPLVIPDHDFGYTGNEFIADGVPVYHLGWTPTRRFGPRDVVPAEYIKLFEKAWAL